MTEKQVRDILRQHTQGIFPSEWYQKMGRLLVGRIEEEQAAIGNYDQLISIFDALPRNKKIGNPELWKMMSGVDYSKRKIKSQLRDYCHMNNQPLRMGNTNGQRWIEIVNHQPNE
jgi:hypothetical protein